jgi:AcrR family transcriptional regulator
VVGHAVHRAALSPIERRRRNREQMLAAILDAARAVMRERGVAALSLREVARRISMRAPSLYEYFPSKAALYDALFLAGFRLFAADCEREVLGATSLWELVRSSFEQYMRFAREHPDLYQLLFEHPVPGFVPSDEAMAEDRALLDRFTQRIADAIEAGEIAPGLSASQARDLIIAMMHGLTAQHLANDLDAAPGVGRYGGLIEPAVALFRASWAPESPSDPTPARASRPTRSRNEGRHERPAPTLTT